MVERLKLYLAKSGLIASQFADAIQMPRSSFSQLMNGRNKTIADTTLVKIHAAFPDLSIPWLLFGEGEMLVDGKKISDSSVSHQSQLSIFSDNSINVNECICEKLSPCDVDNADLKQENVEDGMSYNVSSKTGNVLSSVLPPIGSVVAKGRKISRIMVFYDDNTFECFGPE